MLVFMINASPEAVDSAIERSHIEPASDGKALDLAVVGRIIKMTGTCTNLCKFQKYWIESRELLRSNLKGDVRDSQIAIISACGVQGLSLGEIYTFFLTINKDTKEEISERASPLEFYDDYPCQFNIADGSVFFRDHDGAYLRSNVVDIEESDRRTVKYSRTIFNKSRMSPEEYLLEYYDHR